MSKAYREMTLRSKTSFRDTVKLIPIYCKPLQRKDVSLEIRPRYFRMMIHPANKLVVLFLCTKRKKHNTCRTPGRVEC